VAHHGGQATDLGSDKLLPECRSSLPLYQGDSRNVPDGYLNPREGSGTF